jgi:hypothetical protein
MAGGVQIGAAGAYLELEGQPGVQIIAAGMYLELAVIPLEAPELAVSAVSVSDILIAWDAVEGATAYALQVSVAGGAWQDLWSGSELSYEHGELEPGTEYCYRDRATNSVTASPWSEIVCAAPQLSGRTNGPAVQMM